ncbi:MAG: ATP-dependent helicase HrpB [Polyangia bacterium]
MSSHDPHAAVAATLRGLPTLPIDALLPEVATALASAPSLVIEAPAGAGKTTRVPPLLLNLFPSGDVVVLEPRRLAAHLSAARVAEELGEPLGERVGVQMRFDSIVGPRTRLRFVTEGVLLRQLFAAPELPGVAAVVLDEFHERHLHADLALALLRRLQATRRPELRIVVMSATLSGAQVASFLGEPGAPCRIARSEGRSFPVSVSYASQPSTEPLGKQVRAALRDLLRSDAALPNPSSDDGGGDVLVFLPGGAEIRRCQEDLAELVEPFALDLLPLHGDLPLSEQRRAVLPRAAGARRKVILSTNVAETSVTIDGVTAVIDSGLARIAAHQPWSGLPVLRVQPICRASAAQRAGRAGRTRPGTCVRLYTRHDHDGRPEFEQPEIRRLDLAELVLSLRAAELRLDELAFLDPPPPAAIEAAEQLLTRLGALAPGRGTDRAVTPLGRRMARLPLHPRLSRLLLDGGERGVLSAAATVAALLGERDIRLAQRGQALLGRGPQRSDVASEPSDLLHLFELVERGRSLRGGRSALVREGLDPDALAAVERTTHKLRQAAAEVLPPRAKAPPDERGREQALLQALLAGYPDRVARRRGKGGGETPDFVLAAGGAATLLPSSVAREVDLAVLVEIVDGGERGGLPGRAPGPSSRPQVRLASAIEADWLLELPGEPVRETVEVSWNPAAERVEEVRRLLYDQLVLDESRRPSDGTEPAAVALLSQQAEAANLRPFADGEELPRVSAKLALLREVCPELGLLPPTPAQIRAAVAAACAGKGSFAELAHVSLIDAVAAELTGEPRGGPGLVRELARLLPEHVILPRGRRVRVQYAEGQMPWIESRLQDFFGMTEGPRIAGGRVALVLHLLAPNQRAVQVTTDLRGFWARHYPSIRKELMRRYPKHAWPEDPLGAAA